MDPSTSPTNPSPGPEGLRALLADTGFVVDELVELPGDVSLRRYYRGRCAGDAVIVAWYPDSLRATCQRFLQTGELLRSVGVPVPAILAANCAAGWTLIEDAGESTLFELRHRGVRFVERWRSVAAEHAQRIRELPVSVVARLSPPLDGSALRAEIDLTWEAFLAPNGLVGSWRTARALRQGLETLCDRLDASPLVPCHRDFMARNLVLGARGLLVIDHQDLRLGPTWYDLASLLNDSLPVDDDHERLLRLRHGANGLDYERAAAQRTLKAIGTFCRFALRGHRRHLPLVALSWRQARRHLAGLPELEESNRALARLWTDFPALPEQLRL